MMFATILVLGLLVSAPLTWLVLNKAAERLGWENPYSLPRVTFLLYLVFLLASRLLGNADTLFSFGLIGNLFVVGAIGMAFVTVYAFATRRLAEQSPTTDSDDDLVSIDDK